MKIVALGTGPFAVPTLERLVAEGHEVLSVVARPHRGRAGDPPAPMAAAADRLGLPLWRPESVNTPAEAQRLASLCGDLLVVCDYGEILRPHALAAARLGGVNLHGSLLPRYRGAAPVQWAVLNGDAQTGVTAIQMTPGLDAGPSLGKVVVPIDPDETAGELEPRLAEAGAVLMARVVGELAEGRAHAEPQDVAQATKAPRLRKEDGRIDWSRTARALKNHVRGMNPWPRAYTHAAAAQGEPLRLGIDRAAVIDAPAAAPPGTVVEAGPRLVVACGEGQLEPLEVQPAGKRRMTAAEWLRGAGIAPGAMLR